MDHHACLERFCPTVREIVHRRHQSHPGGRPRIAALSHVESAIARLVARKTRGVDG